MTARNKKGEKKRKNINHDKMMDVNTCKQALKGKL